MDYEILDNITCADIAVSVKGESLNEIFVKAGIALVSEMTDFPVKIRDMELREDVLTNPDLELLLFNFLNEMLVYKDGEGLILKPVKAEIELQDSEYLCRYTLRGEKISESRCGFRVDVKGISLHALKITHSGNSYSTTVVFDV
jgi:SHS2 domain-containing protein